MKSFVVSSCMFILPRTMPETIVGKSCPALAAWSTTCLDLVIAGGRTATHPRSCDGDAECPEEEDAFPSQRSLREDAPRGTHRSARAEAAGQRGLCMTPRSQASGQPLPVLFPLKFRRFAVSWAGPFLKENMFCLGSEE